jgi:CubicO group peptidase (beta-lactamase class C family)
MENDRSRHPTVYGQSVPDASLAALGTWPVTAAAAAVVASGEGVVEATGELDRPFPLASVTKPLVAWAVLVAVEEGTVQLDGPLGPPGSTVRHLLAHASGLAPDAPTAMARPGTKRIYSNAGFEVLGAELAAASGLAVSTYLREALLDPLAMTATGLNGSPAKDAVSSVTDLARFAAELFSPSLVSPAVATEATTVQFPGLAGVLPGFGRQDPNDWGLGLEVKGSKRPHWTPPCASARTFGHFGRTGTFLWVDPEAGVALIVLTDRPFGPWAVDAWPALGTDVLDRWAHA